MCFHYRSTFWKTGKTLASEGLQLEISLEMCLALASGLLLAQF